MDFSSVAKYADLQACCACLGFLDANEYKLDADASLSIRCILRYLRNESSNCDVRVELGKLGILTSDLIPMLKASKTNPTLFDLVIRLMVGLTQPAIVCFRNEIPKDRDLYATFLKVDGILKNYKSAFADEELFRVLADCVEDFFNKSWEDRTDDDRLLIERILVLVRNVLHIYPDSATEHRTDEDVSVHDQLLWTIHLSGWDDLLLFLANTEERSVFAFHVLEIISLMLREQTPQQIANAAKLPQERDPNTQVLERCFLSEQERKRAAMVELSMRHNRFGGTFELLNTQSISSRPLIYHHDVTVPLRRKHLSSTETCTKSLRNIDSIEQVNLDLGKRMRRKACNRRPLIECGFHRRSVLSIQLFLQKFCWQFLRNCYNLLMGAARGALIRHNTQANDETYYLWSMSFFMAFCRLYKFRPQYLSESLNVVVFNWVFTLSVGYHEALLTDKRGGSRNQNALQFSRRLALAVSAYRQFLLCLQEMLRPSNDVLRNTPINNIDDEEEEEEETIEAREHRLHIQKQAAESLISNIFYVAEYQDLVVTLLKDYNESLQSKEYLTELVESSYLLINLLTAQQNSAATFVVSRRKRHLRRSEKRRLQLASHRKRREELNETRNKLLKRVNETPEERSARLELTWGPLSSTLISALRGTLLLPPSEDLPKLFDAAMAEDMESMAAQLRDAIRLVHINLHNNEATRALAIARSMWDIWPEASPSNETGELEDGEGEDLVYEKQRVVEAGLEHSQITEYLALRKIFLLDLAAEELEMTEASLREETLIEDDEEELVRRELEDSSEDDENNLEVVEKETAFDMHAFLLRFTHPHIIRSLTLLLEDYALNPPSTNKHLLHLLYRIAVKQHLPGVLFQLRLFHIFQSILTDPAVPKLEEFKEILRFIKYILRKFFETFERSRAVAVEALFFKSTKEAAEAHSGYGTFEIGSKASQWTTELDKELEQLFEAYRYDPVPKGEDLVDVLKRNLSDPDKSRRQIIMRLIYLGKVASAKNLKMMTIRIGEDRPVCRRRQRRPTWSEEEVNHLRSLFTEYRDSTHRLDDMMTELRLEYERKTQQERDEIPTTVLRSRREVGRKLIELGLAKDAADLGRQRRQVYHHRRVEEKGQLEYIHGDIATLKKAEKRKPGRRGSNRRNDSSPELLCDTAHFSDEEYQRPENMEELYPSENDATVKGKELVSKYEAGRSIYFDPEDSPDEESDMLLEEETSPPSRTEIDQVYELQEMRTFTREKRRKVVLEDEDSNSAGLADENLEKESTLFIGDNNNANPDITKTKARRTLLLSSSEEDN